MISLQHALVFCILYSIDCLDIEDSLIREGRAGSVKCKV